jgi:glycerophosphoryl diester phosphodiesterase
MIYMPIINILKEGQEEMLDEYLKNMPCAAYEIVFPQLTPKVNETYAKIISSGGRVWVNTLWNSLCAGMTDDAAADDRSIYDRHIEMGATIIQSDRPEMLIQHLKSKKLHR